MKTGAMILAAGHTSGDSTFQPLLKIDHVTVIRRIILTLQRSGISPILVITGAQGDIVEKEVSRMDVICLRNPAYLETQMFENVCMGLKYMKDLCHRSLILPAKYPLLLSNTLKRLLETSYQVACPTFQNKRGHPVLISHSLIPDILSYSGENGLHGALMQNMIYEVTEEIPVEDNGIIQSIDTLEDCSSLSDYVRRIPLSCKLDFSICREQPFFTSATARFLSLIAHTGSMQTACRQMNISYSKGWKTIKSVESFLGYSLLFTRTGGSTGGSSQLTPEGTQFLNQYLKMEEELTLMASQLFESYFPDGGMR